MVPAVVTYGVMVGCFTNVGSSSSLHTDAYEKSIGTGVDYAVLVGYYSGSVASVGARQVTVLGFVAFSIRELVRGSKLVASVLLLRATGEPPELFLSPSHLWHLFLSHIWSTGQVSNVVEAYLTYLLTWSTRQVSIHMV